MIGMTVCSGIGAPEVSAPWIDWRYQSEIEPFPCAVLAHRFPKAINLGDMTRFQEWPDATVDVLCGGTPCQSFSVAGLRKGLADPRGNLMLTYLAIADRFRPRWLVWENVPGVLSSNGGRDFGAFLGGLGQLGYGYAYRVLDAQYVRTRSHPCAVPQRRRRVFVVGYLRDWRRAAAVFFDRESLSGHPPPRREAGQGVAPTIAARTRGGGGLGADLDCDGGLICANSGEVGYCLTASAQQSLDAETETLVAVAHALRGEGHDAGEDGTGRGIPLVPIAFDSKGSEVETRADGASPTLRAMTHSGSHANGGGQIAVAFAQNTRNEVRLIGGDGSVVGALGAEPGGKQQAYVAIAFDAQAAGNTAHATGVEVAGALHGGGKHGGRSAVAFDMRGREGGADLEGPHETASIRAADGGSSRSYLALPWAVRRLTPPECERLQGFPDGWTDIPYRGKRAADGPRYKALGNSWAVNCGELIFDRIRAVEAGP